MWHHSYLDKLCGTCIRCVCDMRLATFSCILIVIARYFCCYNPRSDHHLCCAFLSSPFPSDFLSVLILRSFHAILLLRTFVLEVWTPLFVCLPSSPFVLFPPHAQACASNSHEPHQVGASLVQQGGLHCLGSGVRSRRPPRFAYLTSSLASTARQVLGLASL